MRLLSVFILCASVSQFAWAQPPGGGDRGNRGGGGGLPGGGMPGGGFGGGGMPGGGFGGGGFPAGGMPGGGMRGGGDRGGGGGFNPADMLARFDRNNNKMIDPEEAEGPAKFFLERLAQSNPKIDLKRPVPLDLLTKEMEKMRGGQAAEEPSKGPAKPELLVPDFSLDSEPAMVEGFGSTSTKFNVKVEERDLKEAEERIRRYDRNNDGILSKEEIEGNRWSDDPLQYDRNGDGKISKSEMAVRYAKRRMDEKAAPANTQQPGSNGSRGGFMWGGMQGAPGASGAGGWSKPENANARKDKAEEKDRFGDAKSYRMKTIKEKTTGTKGLPDWFARSDADGDGQVLVSEYSSSLTSDSLAEFQKFDLNNDFIITAKECLAAVKNGASSSAKSSSSSSAPASSSASVVLSAGATAPSGSANLDWAKRQVDKYDKNKDGKLSVDEWSLMTVKPDGADANGDGLITAEEYADFRSKKQ